MRNFLLLTVFIGYFISAAHGQEVLQGLFVNPVVMEKTRAIQQGKDNRAGQFLHAAQDTTPITLPFLDDFSTLDVFPSPDRWIDHDAFENDDFALFPVNIGVMTLDAINDSGRMYPSATPGPSTFIADHLTSRYIRLDSVFKPAAKKLSPSDSLFLSFYYQPQGRGKAPQFNDSLILQFLVKPARDSIIPGTGTITIPDQWDRVWFANGMSIDTFYVRTGTWFARVMIPITDPVYFTKKFRFRFYNYVSLASAAEPSWQSNTDQWNIDQVYLHHGRSRFDTVFPEIRFIQRSSSLLKKYAAMPYPQYCDNPTNELRDSLDVFITNRDIVPRMSTYGYTVTQKNSPFLKLYNGGNYNIQPYNISPFVTYQKFAHPEMSFLLPVGQADSAEFYLTHIVRDNAPGSATGDTLVQTIRMQNYYAYDDGTPEASYGLTPAGSKLAYSFKLNKSPDTLRAVRFYFNQTLSDASERLFYLCVWNDNAGKPGDTVYSDLVFPRYADSLHKFVTYHLNPPIAVTGTFYVGWIQTTGDNLSVGFDRFNNSQQSIFFNTSGTWETSAFTGSLMIRPVIGKPIPLGIDEPGKVAGKLRFYPNPITGTISRLTVIPDPARKITESDTYTIYDCTGRIVIQDQFSHAVDVSALPNGLYVMTLQGKPSAPSATGRFMITR